MHKTNPILFLLILGVFKVILVSLLGLGALNAYLAGDYYLAILVGYLAFCIHSVEVNLKKD